jgi:hypothetical protein
LYFFAERKENVWQKARKRGIIEKEGIGNEQEFQEPNVPVKAVE